MASQFTIQQIINIGEVSTYLSFNKVSTNTMYGNKVVKSPDPVNIALFTDILKWHYEGFPNDSTLRGTANYAIWLFGIFQLQAQDISGGGGSVIPVPPSATTPNPISFEVNTSTSPIIVGNDTLSIPSFIGYNLLFNRNNIPQSLTNNGGSYYQWNKVTGIFKCIGIANELELFDLYPTL